MSTPFRRRRANASGASAGRSISRRLSQAIVQAIQGVEMPAACCSVEPLEGRALLAIGPLGTEFQVNPMTGDACLSPAIAVAANGDFVVAWTGHSNSYSTQSGIYARRFNAAGTPLGDQVRVDMRPFQQCDNPVVAMDADGDFVVAWDATEYFASPTNIFARRFSASGVAQGDEFRVTSETPADETHPGVAMDDSGNFVVVWVNDPFNGTGIYAKRYDAFGTAQGTEFCVDSTTDGTRYDPAVAMDSDGDFAVVWGQYRYDAYTYESEYVLAARRYNSAGVAQGVPFSVSDSWGGDPSIAMADSGSFVVAWQNDGIKFRQYNDIGIAGSTMTVPGGSDLREPAVAMDADGDFIIAASVYSGYYYYYSADQQGIRAYRYSAAGDLLGSEEQMSSSSSSWQSSPAVFLRDDHFMVTWEAYGTNGWGIFARGSALSGTAPTDVTLSNSTMAENQPAGVVVGTLSTTDADAGDSFTYALVAGNGATDNALFQIQGNTLKTAISLNYEAKASYSIRVRTTDSQGNSLEKVFTISVQNVNEAPTVRNITGKTLFQDSSLTFAAGDFTAAFQDEDAGNSLRSVKILSLPAHGTLLLGTSTVTLNQQILLAQLGSLKYQPAKGYVGSDSFQWIGSDGALYATNAASVQLTVRAVEAPPFATLANGHLSVSGTDAADTIAISVSGTTLTVTRGSQSLTFTAASVLDIAVSAGLGNDTVSLASSIFRPSTILGGGGRDTLTGGMGADQIKGGGGNDLILGQAGNDVLIGNGGHDDLRGNGGRDRLTGSGGNDTLKGNGGADTLNGGTGTDLLVGAGGNDVFVARDGVADVLNGGAGSDMAQVDSGTDLLTALEQLLA